MMFFFSFDRSRIFTICHISGKYIGDLIVIIKKEKFRIGKILEK